MPCSSRSPGTSRRRRPPTCSSCAGPPTASSSSRPRRSSARSCPARRVRGCSDGPSASGSGRSRTGSRPMTLATADEAFMCSSVAGVLPITRFDGRPDRQRHPRPVDPPRPRRPRAVHRRRLTLSPSRRARRPREHRQALARRARVDELRQAALAGLGALRAHHPMRAEAAVALRLRLPERPARPRRDASRPRPRRRTPGSPRTSRSPSGPSRRRPNAASPAGRIRPGRPQRLDAADVPRAPDAAIAPRA